MSNNNEDFRALVKKTEDDVERDLKLREKIITGVFEAYGMPDSLPPQDLSYAIYLLGSVFMSAHEDKEELERIFNKIMETHHELKK